MKSNKRSTSDLKNRLDLNARFKFLQDLQQYLLNEFDVELGEFEAEEILTFFCENLGPAIYNSGVNDARKYMERRFEEAVEDLGQIEIRE